MYTSASTDLMDAYMLSKEAFNQLQDQSMSEYTLNISSHNLITLKE